MTREGQSREGGRENEEKKKQKETERKKQNHMEKTKQNKTNNPQNGKRKIDVYHLTSPQAASSSSIKQGVKF